MSFRTSSASLLLALLLAGLPPRARAQEIARGPRELGTAVLRELRVREGKLAFRVDSGGCTDAASFAIQVRKAPGAAPRTTHYWLTIRRVRADECKAMLWEGVVLEYDLGRLGLEGSYTLAVTNPVLPELRNAALRAVELERESSRRQLESAEQGTGPQDSAERLRRRLRELEEEQARLSAGAYPAPVPGGQGSVLEDSAGHGAVRPPLLREAVVRLEGPAADGVLLPVQGSSKSGPFYRLAGIAGGDYGLLVPGREYRLQMCLVYRREYFGLIGDWYVHVLEAR